MPRAGRLGTLAPLTATNTVAGRPTTDTGPGSRARGSRWPGGSGRPRRAGSRADRDRICCPACLAPDRSLAEAATALVASLWPVLWQRSLKDVYAADLAAFATGHWACRHLHPFGALPALRVGDLPYGVLPIADFDQWEWRPDDGPSGLTDPLVERAAPRACTSWLSVH